MKKIIQFILLIGTAAVAYAQSLEALTQEALENNPSIQKMDLQYQIAAEKVNEVNTLPNTEFKLGFMALKPEMDMPMTRFSVSAMQMLPWFGTIEARKNYVASMADTQLVDITIAQRKLSLSIAQIYYQIYEIVAQQKVLQENIALLETFEKLALSSVKVGKATSVDVMRLQIRQNELKQEIQVLTQKSEGLKAALNSLINRDYKTPILIEPTLSFPAREHIYSYESLREHPELLRFDKIETSIDQSELVNQKDSKPMLGVGIEYINQTESPMVTSSFKDMVMPMVSLSVPIFNHKYESVTLQNELKKQEVAAQKRERFNELTAQLSKAISQTEQARIKYHIQNDNLEIASNAEKILLKNYETGTIDYDEVLKIQELQLKFQKNQIEAIKTYYEQISLIDYLTQEYN